MNDTPLPELPVQGFEAAHPYLRRPFTPNAVKWKCQTTLSNNRGLCVAYIDARLVSERLNMVCGGDWSYTIEPFGDRIDSGLFVCKLEVDGITRPNVGAGSGSPAAKGGYSDALKRAAVAFGVGVSLYSVPQAILESADKPKGSQLARRARKGGGDPRLFITDGAEKYLRERYAEWLEGPGKVFGEPLDHGDVEGSVGDPDELTGGIVDEPVQEDLALAGAREALEALYEEVTKADAAKRSKLKPGRFKAQLEGAQTAEEIAELQEKVENL